MTTASHQPDDGPTSAPGLLDALAAAERASTVPPSGAQQQTWTRVVGSVTGGGPPPLDPTSIMSPAAASTTPWVKIVLGLVLSGVVGAAVSSGFTSGPEPPPSTQASAPAAPERPPSPTEPPRPPAPSAQPAGLQPPAAPVSPPSPPDPIPAQASAPKKTPAAAPLPRDPPASDLVEETRLLALARARLRDGPPRDALAPLAEHARSFPRGQLTEDRMVLRAQALCRSGDTEAGKTEASALRKAFPSSSHLSRVDRACE